MPSRTAWPTQRTHPSSNVWGGYERLNAGGWEEWNAPLWEQPLELFDAMFTGGVRAHYVALARCARLLIATARSLVVTISFTIPDTQQSAFGVAYAMAKTADDRLARAAALQLRTHGVAARSASTNSPPPLWHRRDNLNQTTTLVAAGWNVAARRSLTRRCGPVGCSGSLAEMAIT